MSASQNTKITRTKSRRRSDRIPWLCGCDSEVEVILPSRYAPQQEVLGKTELLEAQEPPDVQLGRRHQLYRSVSTTIQPRRTGRRGQGSHHSRRRSPRGVLRSSSPVRKDGPMNTPARINKGLQGHRRRQSCDVIFDDNKRPEQEKVLRLAPSATSCSSVPKKEYSDPAHRGHLRRLRKSQSVGASVVPQFTSNIVHDSVRTQQGGNPAAENKPLTESSFNLVLGAALLSLYTRMAAEFGRLECLRRDAETLLGKIQDAVSRLENFPVNPATAESGGKQLDGPVKTYSPTTSLAASESTVDKNISGDFCRETSADSVSSRNLSGGPLLAHDHPDAYGDTDVEDSQTRMLRQMEAELESELEMLGLTMATYHHHPHDSTGLQDLNKTFIIPWSNILDSEPSNYLQERHEYDERHQCNYHGVCPYKLERKLYQLLGADNMDIV